MEQRTCPRCGECFAPKTHNQKYCCRQCGKAVQNAKRRGTEVLPKYGEYHCAECHKHCVRGKNVVAHASKFCSPQCKKRHWRKRNGLSVTSRKLLVKSAGSTAEILHWQSICAAQADIWKVTRVFSCPCCGRRIKSRDNKRSYCSNLCKTRAKRRRSKGRPLRAVWYSGKCRHCDTRYVTDHPTQRTCGSVDCLRRSEHLAHDDYRAHAKRHGNRYVYINKVAIFLRDGLICQECGVLCDPLSDPYKGDTYPTLGHIIPKSRRGGHHVDWNVQCECRRCNRDKGDAPNKRALIECAQALARSKSPLLTAPKVL
jgi:hypothetical protein